MAAFKPDKLHFKHDNKLSIELSYDNAELLAHAPGDIRALVDEVERLQAERVFLVAIWRAADQYNDCNDGLACNCVDKLVKALDKYDVYRGVDIVTPDDKD